MEYLSPEELDFVSKAVAATRSPVDIGNRIFRIYTQNEPRLIIVRLVQKKLIERFGWESETQDTHRRSIFKVKPELWTLVAI